MFRFDRVNGLLDRAGWPQERLCCAAGVAPARYESIEAGKNEPNCREIVRIAQALGVTTDYLLGMDIPEEGVTAVEDRPGDSFCIRFNRLLAESSVTSEEVSAHTGRKLSAVIAWKKGRQIPDGNSVVRMADLFGCTTDYLLGATVVREPVQDKVAH